MNATSDWCGIEEGHTAMIVARDDEHAAMG
jgi:hypothetical protein